MKSKIIKKLYNKEDKLFHIIKTNPKGVWHPNIDKTYDNFDAFYKALKKDLKNADLLYYDFNDCDALKYDLSKAMISSQTMLKIGKYDKKFERLINKDNDLISVDTEKTLDIVECRKNIDISQVIENDEDIAVCYISDLHINHKIVKNFPNSVNKYELKEYLKSLVLKIKDSIPISFAFKRVFIVLVGDFSLNFEIFKLFFQIYKEHIGEKTFYILGNHELWDKKLIKKHNTIEDIVEEYREFLSSLNSPITLLENQLYLPNCSKHIFGLQEILKATKEELRHLFANNPYVIVGGLGYAGLNDKYNADLGLYRDAPINRELEIKKSKLIEKIHSKLRECVPDKKIFFVTHMPKEDWTNDNHVANWIYINGHTHHNYYCEDNSKHVFADNQIGYDRQSFGLKYITTSSKYDLFEDFSDGIHEINREQYVLFYRGIGTHINFNRKFKKLYMIKRDGTYCFLIELDDSKGLKLLSGGVIQNIGNHDLQYFYNNLSNYSNSIKQYLTTYTDFQKRVSQEIKSIGGSGNIHGCIIDIDYYNHVYINPLDATITPYFAYSMTEKYVYQNLQSLLKYRCNELYLNYKDKVDKNKGLSLQIINKDIQENKNSIFVEDTEMYKVSRIIKGLQYTTKYNIVRMWNDVIIGNCSKESGKLIVKGLLNNSEQKDKKQKLIEKYK